MGTGVAARLVFMPDKSRDIRKTFDVSKEAYVAHYARFFSLPQFAVLAAELLKVRGEPIWMGWCIASGRPGEDSGLLLRLGGLRKARVE